MSNQNWLNQIRNLPSVDSNIRFFGGHKHRVEKGWSVSEESHYAFEILIILKGEQLTTTNQHEYTIHQDDILLIPPGYKHTNTCISEEGMQYFCAHFDIDEPQIHHDFICYCDFIFTKENKIHASLKKILLKWINLLNNDTSSILTKLETEIILFELIMELVKYAETKKISDVKSNDRKLYYARCISELIKQNLREFSLNPSEDKLETLTMAYIANQLNISTGYLLVIFKSVYNTSPKSYLNHLKFNEAKLLLGQPNISLSEIGERIGYRNVSHFSRQFKLWSGISPNEFRNILQIKNAE